MSIIDLDGFDYSPEGFIIVDDDSPFEFTRQTGGVSCNHQQARGYFIPIDVDGELQNRACCRYIDDDLASWISYRLYDFIADGGEEAWITGTLKGRTAILTWNNCD